MRMRTSGYTHCCIRYLRMALVPRPCLGSSQDVTTLRGELHCISTWIAGETTFSPNTETGKYHSKRRMENQRFSHQAYSHKLYYGTSLQVFCALCKGWGLARTVYLYQ
jgi:hypothetical protein